jgi:osmoprotectant transport system permease protein
MRAMAVVFAVLVVATAAACLWLRNDQAVVVGSKNFNESYILGEIMAQLLEDRGFAVDRRFGLGGTLIGFEALRIGGLDLYAEYSGTLEQAILKSPRRLSYPELQAVLEREYGMNLLEPFGLNNTYALALRRSRAESLGLRTIGDLARHSELRCGFTHDFLHRADGWAGLARTYGLTVEPSALEHGLAYPALREDRLDVTDAYATDGEIDEFDLVLLEDDREYFPKYLAAPLLRGGLDPRIPIILRELAGQICDAEMKRCNALVNDKRRVARVSFAAVAQEFLRGRGLLSAAGPAPQSKWAALGSRVMRHLQLTLVALVGGIVVAIPLGVLVYRTPRVAQPVVYLAGTLQTIPSLALLAFMIPLFQSIGAKPAIAALFLYSLLPILRNTAMALFSIDPVLKKVSVGMGLTPWQRLWHIELPLAAPTILAGIKTAAVINIGTATLAAYIGAGGLGDPIVTGLALYDPRQILLEGAIPAALLAIFTEIGFERLEKVVIPRHLLQKPIE